MIYLLVYLLIACHSIENIRYVKAGTLSLSFTPTFPNLDVDTQFVLGDGMNERAST